MTNFPNTTYRIQFHAGFTLENFRNIIPYLQHLGVQTIYASPIFSAVPGSTHGYDGINPNQINPEIGTEQELREILITLKYKGIGWIQDIVPNHLAFHPENTWLNDFLEKGLQSTYAQFFDQSASADVFHGRMMLPVLAETVEEAILQDKLQLAYRDGRLELIYGEQYYPASPESYLIFFETLVSCEKFPALRILADEIRNVVNIEEVKAFTPAWSEIRMQFKSLMEETAVGGWVNERLGDLNKDSETFDTFLSRQHYVFTHWQETATDINFRRFFTVNGLIGLNVHRPDVFTAFHELIGTFVRDGLFSGLRVDHVDGLYDPTHYLHELRNVIGEETYLLVEKILVGDEELPGEWPLQGTTGYDFLGAVNNLFTNKDSSKQFTNFYQNLTGDNRSPSRLLLGKKRLILLEHMGGELDNLCRLLTGLLPEGEIERIGNDTLRNALAAFLIHCPVYRYYGREMPLPAAHLKEIEAVVIIAGRAHPELLEGLEVLLGVFSTRDETVYPGVLDFYLRCMQLTGPLMAKGGEDTLMYTYDRFIGHNDVGDAVDNFGISSKQFHAWVESRQAAWPRTMNTTSTHDTKRGEDVRARLNVLTDLADEWFELVRLWKSQYADLRKRLQAPDENDEYLIYQVLVGSMPFEGPQADDYQERLADYFSKALREGKVNSDWAEPNEEYENGTIEFVHQLLKSDAFLDTFIPFFRKVSDFGIQNSLSQLTLKTLLPGVPDFYQGCELWDFSLVDPDNRRPVDYAERDERLKITEGTTPDELWAKRSNGNVKLWLTKRLLELRKNEPLLFQEGDYIPLKTDGKFKAHVFAFLRKRRNDVLLTVIPLHLAGIRDSNERVDWEDTTVILPEGLSKTWKCVLTGTESKWEENFPVGQVLSSLPVGVFRGIRETKRGSGLLLHISSLPSQFGIGDLGSEAYRFADFLHGAGQKVWQLLPLNPIDRAQEYSPYSALSAFAGNPLLISLESLAQKKWLNETELRQAVVSSSWKVDYAAATALKYPFLKKAYQAFRTDESSHADFEEFCSSKSTWLDDFALFMAIRDHEKNAPWTDWSDDIRGRKPGALAEARRLYADEIRYQQWLQFVFFGQWKELKNYCADRGIRLMGDLPFYVSHHSADVWANPALFKLDASGNLTGVAGVPPDNFSETGQLWGMPVFDWGVSERDGHSWWFDRLRANIEIFDFVRLDHFRAFYDFWEVAVDAATAENGHWVKGPGKPFFDLLEIRLGALPFVAEDLGDINAGTRCLRDDLKMPGMKVLQYGFGKRASETDHALHHHERNFLAYTGTHDNNTTRGWYREELDGLARHSVSEYVGYDVTEENVSDALINLAFSSVCDLVIIQLQDLLGLDEQSRMNFPGKSAGNWVWRLVPGQLTKSLEADLLRKTLRYDRI